LHDKDTPQSILQRGEILLNSLAENKTSSVTDDTLFKEQKQKKLHEQELFLSQMQHLHANKETLDVTNYYMDIPIQSAAKIIDIQKDAMTISVRKISAVALELKDSLYIKMPKKPNVKAKVKNIDKTKSLLTLHDFEYVDASPLDRRNVHVSLSNPLEILVKLDKIQLIETLTTVSITTFIVHVHYLYNITVGSELTMFTQLLETEDKFIGVVDKIIPAADTKFKLIVHLKPTPSIEKSLVPFVSQRQLEIIKELQEKSL
jgi:hypothetical protein